MTRLEQSLRDLFAQQVARTPAVDDAATRAIHAARRQRRRRTLAGSLASVVLLATLTGLTGTVWNALQDSATGTGGNGAAGPFSPILPPSGPAGPLSTTVAGDGLVDFRLVNRVWTVEGHRILLSGSSVVDQVYRTPYGLLYDEDDRLLLRWDYGGSRILVDQVSAWLIDRDASRLAYVSGDTAVVTSLSEEGIGDPTSVSPVPEGATPVTFWGDRLVLQPPGGGYRVWDVPTGRVEPVGHEVQFVYGPGPDGLLVLVQGSDGYCLAVLGDGLPPERAVPLPSGCVPGLRPDKAGWLSPTGEWLALPLTDALLLTPVPSVDAPPADDVAEDGVVADPLPHQCPWRAGVVPVWWDARTILSVGLEGAVRCGVDGSLRRLVLPESLSSGWRYVPPVG